MVFPDADYDNNAFTFADGQYSFAHEAFGAELIRFSWDYGQNWSTWTPWENVTKIDASTFAQTGLFWNGQHIIVQCLSYYFFAMKGSVC